MDAKPPPMMWVVPKAGLKVRDPVSRQHLPETGAAVLELDQHWNRCLISGDVVRGVAPSCSTPEAVPAPTPTETDPTPAS